MGAYSELAASLLEDVRNFLDITWEDERGDVKLLGILDRGMTYIGRLTSRELDFGEGTKERELLLEYARYARCGALDEFARNYLTEINSFQIDEEVRAIDGQAEEGV